MKVPRFGLSAWTKDGALKYYNKGKLANFTPMKHHLWTDPPGTSWCGEHSGFPLLTNPSDRGGDGIDTGLNKTIFHPDFWCPKCLKVLSEVHPGHVLKIVYPCKYTPQSQCNHSIMAVNQFRKCAKS